MRASPRVSIVLATCRRPALLDEALASVAGQTFRDWECLVVDDDGGAPTGEVIARYASADARFHHLRTGGAGGSPARTRNVGVEASRGEFVAFLDDDDRFLAGKLERQVASLDRDPAAVLACGRVQEFGARRGVWPAAPLPSRLTRAQLLAGNEVATSTAMVRRAALGASGGFDEALRVAEDYALWLRLLRDGHALFDDAVLAEYRVHGGNISGPELEMMVAVEGLFRSLHARGEVDDACLRRRVRAINFRRAALASRWSEKARWTWRSLLG